MAPSGAYVAVDRLLLLKGPNHLSHTLTSRDFSALWKTQLHPSV